MSIAEDSFASLMVADFANEDAAKKINLLGAGWSVTHIQPTGVAGTQSVVASWQVPAKYRGEEFAASLTLVDATGNPVSFPDAAGGAQKLRVQRLYTVDPPQAPGVALPAGMPSNFNIVINLSNGLPLPGNEMYAWVFEIDANVKAKATFYVAGPRQIVVG